MSNLRYQSLLSVLESNQCKRVSFKGLKDDHPAAFGGIKQRFIELESFEMLYVLETQSSIIDDLFYIFVRKDLNYPIIITKRDYYNREQYESVCQQASINVGDLDALTVLSEL